MIYQFKPTARIPAGITPEMVLSELNTIEEQFGKRTPELAADAVIKDPDSYPALRAFGPDSPEQAYRDGIRNGITYAVRAIIEVPEAGDPIRALFLVTDDEGDRVWEPITVIARHENQRVELIRSLRRDAAVFAAKMQGVLAEIARLIEDLPGTG